ncbi:TIR domain-containing protein, partial [Leptolyngbya cf. ectocarpi LEGE 11479]
MTDVFISYSRKDTDFVRVLHQALSHSKFEAWVDWQDIPLTADWWEEIQRGIEAADTFIFVISPESISSKVCRQEVEHATSHNKRMVPIVHREGFDDIFMHEALSRHNWLYFRQQDDFDQTFSNLVQAINLDLPYVRMHTRLLTRAVEWEHSQRRDDLLLRGQDLLEAEQWLRDSIDQQKEPLTSEQHKTFISKSREVETANQRLLKTGEQARRQVRFGRAVLGLTLLAAAGVGLLTVAAYRQLHHAQIQALITEANTAFKENRQTGEALTLALQAGDQLQQKRLLKGRQELTSKLLPTLLKTNYWILEQDRLEDHTNDVLSVTISDDGQHYVTASADGTAILWDRAGAQPKPLEGHDDWVREAGFTPAGDQVVTVSDDRTVRFWTLEGRQKNHLAAAHDDYIYSLDFSPISNTFATASEDGTVKLWTLAGDPIKTLMADGVDLPQHDSAVRSVRFNQQGQLATAGRDGMIRLWNAQGQLLSSWAGHTEEITALAFSPATVSASQQLASVALDGKVKLWNLEKDNAVRTLTLTPPGPADELWSIAFSSDGQWIAAGGHQDKVYVWRRRDGVHVATLEGHTDRIRSVAFSPDNTTLVSTAEDNTVRLWRWPNPGLIALKIHQDEVFITAISPDGERIALAGIEGTVSLWDKTGGYLDILDGLDSPIYALDLASNNKLAVAMANGRVGLWRSQPANPVFFMAHDDESAIRSLAFSPDGQRFATASDDGTTKIWPTAGPFERPLVVLEGHEGPIYNVSFSSDGNQLVTAGDDGTVRLWNAKGKEIRQFLGSGNAAYHAQFSPDDSQIVSVGEDAIGRMWQVDDGAEVATLQGHG